MNLTATAPAGETSPNPGILHRLAEVAEGGGTINVIVLALMYCSAFGIETRY